MKKLLTIFLALLFFFASVSGVFAAQLGVVESIYVGLSKGLLGCGQSG